MRSNARNRIAVAAMAVVMIGGLTGGCIGVGGSDRTYVTRPTVGQELSDLKRARETGAIDDAEYARLKAQLLDRHEHHGGGR